MHILHILQCSIFSQFSITVLQSLHILYEKTIGGGYHGKDELDPNLRRYATYNKGAAYKEIKEK